MEDPEESGDQEGVEKHAELGKAEKREDSVAMRLFRSGEPTPEGKPYHVPCDDDGQMLVNVAVEDLKPQYEGHL